MATAYGLHQDALSNAFEAEKKARAASRAAEAEGYDRTDAAREELLRSEP